jgi:hypothetical protein
MRDRVTLLRASPIPRPFRHFGAIVTIAQGIVVLARVSLTSLRFYVEAVVPLAMGLGVWVGVRIAAAVA